MWADESTRLFENDLWVKLAIDKMVVKDPDARELESAEDIEKVIRIEIFSLKSLIDFKP